MLITTHITTLLLKLIHSYYSRTQILILLIILILKIVQNLILQTKSILFTLLLRRFLNFRYFLNIDKFFIHTSLSLFHNLLQISSHQQSLLLLLLLKLLKLVFRILKVLVIQRVYIDAIALLGESVIHLLLFITTIIITLITLILIYILRLSLHNNIGFLHCLQRVFVLRTASAPIAYIKIIHTIIMTLTLILLNILLLINIIIILLKMLIEIRATVQSLTNIRIILL